MVSMARVKRVVWFLIRHRGNVHPVRVDVNLSRVMPNLLVGLLGLPMAQAFQAVISLRLFTITAYLAIVYGASALLFLWVILGWREYLKQKTGVFILLMVFSLVALGGLMYLSGSQPYTTDYQLAFVVCAGSIAVLEFLIWPDLTGLDQKTAVVVSVVCFSMVHYFFMPWDC